MSWWIVFRKECLDAARDRRSIAVACLTMMAGPVVVALVMIGITRGGSERGPIPVAIEGAERAPSLAAWLRANDAVEPSRDAVGVVRLVVSKTYADDLRSGRPARVTIEIDSSVRQAKGNAARLQSLLDRFASQVVAVRLIARGVDPAVASPLDIHLLDRATIAPLAAAALATIPIFLMTAVFVGSMNLAIDATAGERERRSLEPLLLHPVSPFAIASGKWLATFAASVISACGMLVFMRLVFNLPVMRELPIRIAFGWRHVALLALLLVPLAALAAALQLALAMGGKNFKEAQSYLSMLLLAPMVPGFLFAFGAAEPTSLMRAMPLTGHQLLASEILQGKGLAPAGALGLALACGGATFVLLAVLSRFLGREDVLRAA